MRSYRPREGFCACVLQDVTEQALLDRRLREERRLLPRELYVYGLDLSA